MSFSFLTGVFVMLFISNATIAQVIQKNIFGQPVANPSGCIMTGMSSIDIDEPGRQDSTIFKYNNARLVSSITQSSPVGRITKDSLLYTTSAIKPTIITMREDRKTLIFKFTYDSAYRIKSVEFPGSAELTRIEFAYQNDKNLFGTIYSNSNQPVSKFKYEFDNNYNVKQVGFDIIKNGQQIHVGEINYTYDLSAKNPFVTINDYRFVFLVHHFGVTELMSEGSSIVLGNNFCTKTEYNYSYGNENVSGVLNFSYSGINNNGFPKIMCVHDDAGLCSSKKSFSYSCN